MHKAVYAGSFDPPTNGHVDILRKTITLFDGYATILIATNPSKKCMFSPLERRDIWAQILLDLKLAVYSLRIYTLPLTIFTADWASIRGYSYIIRGLRGASDMEEEQNIYDINAHIAPIETVYLMAEPSMRAVSSSVVKGLVGHEEWLSVVKKLVPQASLTALRTKYESTHSNISSSLSR